MPIIKTKKGYKYGKKGHVYPNRGGALNQMRAIKASQSRRKKK